MSTSGQKRPRPRAALRRAVNTALEALEPRYLFADLPSGFAESLVVGGLNSPTAMAFSPDGRLFVNEKSGSIRVIKNGQLLPTPFATVTANTFGERGLGGIAFDPLFATNHYVYVYYTADSPTPHNRVSRFTANGDVSSASGEMVLLDLPGEGIGQIHNGGGLAFSTDGKLIIGTGDHSSPLNGQNMSVPFGKLLRINTDGSIPSDNPFYDTATGVNRAIWALGLRNPFTMAVQPSTGRMFVNDVGQMDWEEINEAAAGANYGWATTEGTFDPQAFPGLTNPIHAYSHAEGFAITGGAFYEPAASPFPADFIGDYFYADYVLGWIKRIDPVTMTVNTFATGAVTPLDLDVASDGSLYYLARETNSIYRITATYAPQISAQPASQLISVGQPVTFTVGASGESPLSYQWRRNGATISGAISSSYTIAETVLADNAASFDCIVTNSLGSVTSSVATLSITTDQPPAPFIAFPAGGSLFRGGQTINYSGAGVDQEDGILPVANMTWWVNFHHDTHFHPFIAPFSGSSNNSFVVPNLGDHGSNVWYRIHLRVTDSAGFVRETYRDVHPRLATITVQTNQPGLSVSVDGQPRSTPAVITGVVGMTRSLSVAPVQKSGGISYRFGGWSDAGGSTHDITFPETNTTYTAQYQPYTDYYLTDLDWVGTPIGSPMKDQNFFGGTIMLDGVPYTRGIGGSAGTQVIYDLDGFYERFMSVIGRDDLWGDFGSVNFEVWLDGVKAYDSGVMLGSTPSRAIDIDVTGAQEMRLVITNGGDDAGADQANWADARLRRYVAATPTTAPTNFAGTAPLYNRTSLSWSSKSTNVLNFKVERSIDNLNFAEIATLPADTRTFIDRDRAGDTTYYYRVRASNAVGESAYTPVVTLTTPASTIPPAWLERDIGSIPASLAGSASFDGTTYSVRGSGADIGYEADAFHFLYQTLTGDGEIIARVTHIDPTRDIAKAGVMMRETLDPGSRSAMMSVGAFESTRLLSRVIPNNDTTVSYGAFVQPPRWVKLVRAGNSFTGYQSADGANWVQVGSMTIAMGQTVYVGLAVTSGYDILLNTPQFTNVSITNEPTVTAPAVATPSTVTGSTTDLTVLGTDDGGEANLTYTWSALIKPEGAADPLFSANGTHAASSSTATFSSAGTYTLRATISDGSHTVTSDVVVTVSQTLTGLLISPRSTALVHNAAQQFVATALDQFGDAMEVQPPVTWTLTGVGSLSAAGMYLAPATDGAATVTATVGALEDSVTFNVVRAAPEFINSPSAVVHAAGITAVLNVLGTSEDGEPALTYTWSTILAPDGGAVTFSDNATNSAKSSTATFTKAGDYTLRVTLFDGHLSVTSDVIVTVQHVLTSIALTPLSATIVHGTTRQFVATAHDQFNDVLTVQPEFTWQATGGGTITAAGLYTAPAAPTSATVTVTSGLVQAQTTFDVLRNAPTVINAPAAVMSASGITATLSTLGDVDEGEAGLTYTWSALNVPTGGGVSFGANGTNAAKNSVATFTKHGSYTLRVTMTDGVLSTTSDVTFVVAQVLTGLQVTPSTASVPNGGTQQLGVLASNQFGSAMIAPQNLVWSVTGGGTITASGLYTAPSSPTTATVTATSGTILANATIIVTRPLPTVVTPANAVMNASGVTANLSVLGNGADGEGELIYEWFALNVPSGGAVSFSDNDSNGAKNTVATFTKVGQYSLRVAIFDGTYTVVSDVIVNVAPVVADIVLTPSSPATVTATSREFSAAIFDQFGQAITGGSESSYIYTWSTTLVTEGGSVTFSENASNAAKVSIATFTRAGEYSLHLTVTSGAQSLEEGIDVGVNQMLTSLTVTPALSSMFQNTTQQFSFLASDQFGDPMENQPTIEWDATGGGTISASGLYTAPGTNATVTVTATSGAVIGSANFTVVRAAPTFVNPAGAVLDAQKITAAISARGSGQDGEAPLIYTWSATELPVGGSVSFGENGTNAAKNSVATFTKAGQYTLRVSLFDGFFTITSDVVVNVDQVVTSIALTPAITSLPHDASQQFAATARDQFNNLLAAPPTFTWDATGGGTISPEGLYTAPTNASTVTVTVTSGTVVGSLQFEVSHEAPTVATPAAAIVDSAGITAALSVLGASDGGEAGLIYTWSVLNTPAGGSATFGENGTNTAKSSLATFTKAGVYTLRAAISSGPYSVTSDVEVTVNQVLTSLSVAPLTIRLAPAETHQFSITARDQFNNLMSPPASWSATGSGSVDSSGLFTAGSTSGPATVTVSSGSLQASADVTVDADGPAATLDSDPLPVAGAATWTFDIHYSDDLGVKFSSLGDGDVILFGPSGQQLVATLLDVDAPGDGAVRVATYGVSAPGGFWNSAEDGTWSVILQAGEVCDVGNNFAASGTIGTFSYASPFALMTPGGVLTIDGTGTDDTITLVENGGNLEATIGATTLSFATSSQTAIVIHGYAGNDVFNFDFTLSQPITFSGGSGNNTLNINGGTFTLTADAHLASADLTLNVNGGAVTFETAQHLAGLHLTGGTASLSAGEHVLSVGSLSLDATSRLDLANGTLIVTGGTLGTWGVDSYTGISGLLDTGRGNGSWTGFGIVSSYAASSGGLTSLSISKGSELLWLSGEQTMQWHGETVGAETIMVTFTYGGDANMDGRIDGDDYFYLDLNYNKSGIVFGWRFGDFNFDGAINGDDYIIIDSNIDNQDSLIESFLPPLKLPL